MLKQCLILVGALLASLFPTTHAADVGSLAEYLTDDVAAVGYLDLAKFDARAVAEEFAQLGVGNEGEIAHLRQEAPAVQEFYDELTRRGARRAWAMVRTTDVRHGGPSWVIETTDAAAATKVAELLATWVADAQANPSIGGPAALAPRELATEGNVVLGAATPEQLALLKESRASGPREDAAPALAALLAADCGFVGFGDRDSRRVVREMFPQLPAPFMEIDGKLIADGVAWVGITVKLPPDPTVGLTIEAASPAVATTLKESAVKGIALLKAICLAHATQGSAEAITALPVLALLDPKLAGNRLSIVLGDDDEETIAFRSVIAPAVQAARESGYRNQRMSHFKELALVMMNYVSAKGTYPPSASYDAAGKPLLSWRVLVLPYMEEMALYREFHLDEPWDSAHNRTLIERMPEMYADPAEPGLATAGRTTYLVPTGPGLVFGGREGTKLRDIKDGTSNTILVVEVAPERAVPWTKPEDWEVDLADPLRGVKRPAGEHRGGVFTSARCDGSAMMIADKIDPTAFKAMLTIAGEDSTSASENK